MSFVNNEGTDFYKVCVSKTEIKATAKLNAKDTSTAQFAGLSAHSVHHVLRHVTLLLPPLACL